MPSVLVRLAVASQVIHNEEKIIMALGFDIGRILEQYTGAAPGTPPQVEQDFDNVAQNAPHEQLSHGLSEAFRSDQTPPFAEMVGQLFSQSDAQQRTGMLNQLLSTLGPSVIGSLLGGGALGGLLNRSGGQQVQLTPEQAEQLSPEQVQEIARKAEQQNPGVVEQMSGFYAQHPNLIKALGGAALAIALGRMARSNR